MPFARVTNTSAAMAAQWELDGPRITGPMPSLKMLPGSVVLMMGGCGLFQGDRWSKSTPIASNWAAALRKWAVIQKTVQPSL